MVVYSPGTLTVCVLAGVLRTRFLTVRYWAGILTVRVVGWDNRSSSFWPRSSDHFDHFGKHQSGIYMPQGPEFIRCDYPNPLPSHETLRLLNRVHKQSRHHRVRQRAHCIVLSSQGYTTTHLADIFQV
ncbi:hypothetical protein C2W62_29685, partial [Candidatus Entotheonella serta]